MEIQPPPGRQPRVINDVEMDLGLSYPTIHSRLDELVRAFGFGSGQRRVPRAIATTRRDRRRLIPQELRDQALPPDVATRHVADLEGGEAVDEEPVLERPRASQVDR